MAIDRDIKGGVAGDGTKSSMDLLSRAISEAWDMPAGQRTAAARTAVKIMLESTDARARLRAAALIERIEENTAALALSMEKLALERDRLGNEGDTADEVLRLPDTGPWAFAGTYMDADTGELRSETPPHPPDAAVEDPPCDEAVPDAD